MSARLPHDLDWVAYLPKLDAPDLGACVVLSFDAWSFFRALTTHNRVWFKEPGAGLGRYVDLLRDYAPCADGGVVAE